MSEDNEKSKKYFQKAVERIKANNVKMFFQPVVSKMPRGSSEADMLREVRSFAEKSYTPYMGAALAQRAAANLTLEHLRDYLRGTDAPHEKALARAEERDAAKLEQTAILDNLFKDTRVLQEVYKKARLRDPRITLDQVRTYRRENLNLEKRPSKYNSWVANNARDEYQADLLFFDDLRARDDGGRERVDYYAGLILVDSFSKKVAIVPMATKSAEDIIAAFKRGFAEMGGPPKMIYCDADSGIMAAETRKFLEDHKVVVSITSTHAPLAERMIGYMKGKIFHRLQSRPGQRWWNVAEDVVREYNSEHQSRATKMTPNEAARDANHDQVKQNLEANRRSDNPQPKLLEGDVVRVRIKKKFEKGYRPDWSDKLYTVAAVIPGNAAKFVAKKHPVSEDVPLSEVGKNTVDPQNHYRLRPLEGLLGAKRGVYMRHELLFVRHKTD